ncbi:relaxase/mobilization nuclease domain-containing protein [Nitrobacter sp.]|uniref:relaxase/mobilization nuclease domain-containing protein n=1 Tax=Nitrobacter sp. TaxID=29420 RepID=UPI002631645F|nr:relaxase/mobilization nuclease domain-containing protein [Nitrobacter sp.]
MTTELGGQQVEMLAVANGAPRVEYPIVHIIVSWQNSKEPDPSQIEDTVDTILAMTGLSVCPTLFAQHTNTEHPHLHIAVVRADPASGEATGSEWLIEDLHQAIAILEERHGWASEPNALYYARNGAVFYAKAGRIGDGSRSGKIVDPATEVMVRNAAGKFLKPRDRNGVATEIVNLHADIIRARDEAKDWADFHALLEIYQIAYRAKGSGARIHIGATSHKASTVDPDLALKQMEKRFGPFIPNPSDRIPGFDEYREAHKAQLKRLRAKRAKAQASLDAWAKDRLSEIAALGNRLVERAVRAERDAAKRELNDAFAAAIKSCTNARHTKVEHWRDAGSPVLPPEVSLPSLLLQSDGGEKVCVPPAGLRAEPHEWSTRYYDQADRLVFTDHRIVIIIHYPPSTDGLDAALTMAAKRWGTVRVEGAETFKQRCAERAMVLGITVINHDNKPLIAKPPPSVAKSISIPPPTSFGQDPAPDPARLTAIQRTRSYLDQLPVLPTRRRKAPGDDEAKAPLEIVVETDRFDAKPELKTAALFEEDPSIQAYLQKRRAEMLVATAHHLVRRRFPLDKKSVVDALSKSEGLGRAAFLAFEDVDFQLMLKRVELDRAKVQNAARRTDSEHLIDASIPILIENTDRSIKLSTADEKAPVRTDEDFEIEWLQSERSKNGPSR